jgi:hypothetical protein
MMILETIDEVTDGKAHYLFVIEAKMCHVGAKRETATRIQPREEAFSNKLMHGSRNISM